ncbi:hypothetical protein FD20_GL002216 [Liquorilactobacillus uvarum DSM 19971]|uniref:Type II toxin-antitoxin system RelE/ParE family toxin n=2 Tax=Liquorilactobacillus uvarum TaxID=303240 RepID=A0A0R1PKY7_9LACO|nr:hypothetical protein FD20_GL002216 [Liquorilactobacillus uvarum DSM 19971]
MEDRDKKLTFDYVKRNDGSSEFEEFLNSIPVKDKVKLLRTIQAVENNGLQIATRLEWVKKLDSNVYEVRSKLGNNIQRGLYFHKKDNKYIITHGFTKKTQKTPPREVKHAKNMRDRYLKEHKEGKNE